MSIPIVWSDTAELTFNAIVTYLEDSWGETSALKFVRRANRLLLNLSRQPSMFKSTELDHNVRIGLITPQVSVVYKIHPEHFIFYIFGITGSNLSLNNASKPSSS